MAQGPSDTILVAIRITLRIRESKVRNPDPPDRRRFVLCECILVFILLLNDHIISGYKSSWLVISWFLKCIVCCSVLHFMSREL